MNAFSAQHCLSLRGSVASWIQSNYFSSSSLEDRFVSFCPRPKHWSPLLGQHINQMFLPLWVAILIFCKLMCLSWFQLSGVFLFLIFSKSKHFSFIHGDVLIFFNVRNLGIVQIHLPMANTVEKLHFLFSKMTDQFESSETTQSCLNSWLPLNHATLHASKCCWICSPPERKKQHSIQEHSSF